MFYIWIDKIGSMQSKDCEKRTKTHTLKNINP